MGRFLAASLVFATLSGRALACDVALPDHVRISDCRLAAAVASAAGRSALLKTLLERIDRVDGLVYVMPPPAVGRATQLLGGLSHNVSVAGRYRVLQIFVSGRVDDGAMAIVGHELRHALEVLELSHASTEADVEALFDRLGWRTSAKTVETQAALDAGYAIERELKAARHQHGSSNKELAP